ncbi:enolase C-terminal domain-like protein [Solirubrobacter soli]|uniref:enolase C-terminal domain-like protein n=1 Tax=Solirubrobacter soli TaxID=363832 RepID=UPI000409DFF6|nr:enolase C-terminal domain-like protein [Solirubrobacter soli]
MEAIRSVRARAVEVPMPKPVETAAGTLRTTPLVLIDVTTTEGVTGHAYVRTYTPVAMEPLARLINSLEPLANADLYAHFKLLGTQGLTGIAIAGIDMAHHDAIARTRDVPLVTLLGGEPRPIPAYASLRSMGASAAAEEAEAARAQGFTTVKMKSGADLAAVRAVRSAVSDLQLMVDFNQSLTVDQALRLGLDALDLYWIEEPTRADDYAGHARIRAATSTPLQLGENAWGPNDIEKVAEVSDHVMLDAQKVGGVTGWLEAARRTTRPISSHAFPEISAHLLAVTPTAHLLEYLDHAAPILRHPVQVKDGHVLIPDHPGSGIEWR